MLEYNPFFKKIFPNQTTFKTRLQQTNMAVQKISKLQVCVWGVRNGINRRYVRFWRKKTFYLNKKNTHLQ